MPIFRGRTQRRTPLSAFGNSKVKKNIEGLDRVYFAGQSDGHEEGGDIECPRGKEG